jgi:hypothetical protein
MIKPRLLAAALAVSLTCLTLPAGAAVYSQVAPPPPRSEAMPQPRRGYAWAPGYWDWRGKRHVWVQGHWMRERPGYRYNAPRWEQRDGRWAMDRGRWMRGDRDGDGVPNGMDRRPDDPRRR